VPTDLETLRDVASSVSRSSRSSVAGHAGFLEAEVVKGRNAVALYQDLVEHHGYEGSYDAVKRFVRRFRCIDPKVSCRFETAPGQVITAKERRRAMRAAASTQAAALRDDARYEAPRVLESRLALAAKVVSTAREGICLFRRCSSNDSSRTSKRVFSSPTSYESELNALNPATPAHHGVLALLCRPYAPDSKGKVESAVGHTQSTALQGR
jgi:hypothetical protein